MWRPIRGVSVVLVAGIVLAGCAQPLAPATSSTPTATPQPTAAPLADKGPLIDWDHPFGAEGVSVDPAVLVANPQALGVRFTVTVPVYPSARLRWVDVSSHATVAFMFDFSADPRFPTDGRVQVEESAATMTQAELILGPRPGQSLTRVGSVIVVLVQYGGVGNAMFIRDGVLYDVLGPALPPDAAVDLATQLIATVSTAS
jgi:hypothetical protein